MMNIAGLKILLRKVATADDTRILSAAECPEVSLMHGNEFSDIGKVRSYIDLLQKEYDGKKYRTMAIAEKSTDSLLGLITLDTDKIFPRAEISYWIDKAHRNKGYATEAVTTVIKYGFGKMQLNRIQAMHFTNNFASGRVLEKSGMIYEGTLRQYVGFENTFFDCKMYSILKNDFISST